MDTTTTVRTVRAHMCSMDGGFADVEIVKENGCNDVVVRYNGKYYTAVYNGFVDCYYVDDKYGELADYNKEPKRDRDDIEFKCCLHQGKTMTLDYCEGKCPKYSSCDTVAQALDDNME